MLPAPIRQSIRDFVTDNPYWGRPDDVVWAAVRSSDRSDPVFGQAVCVLLERTGGLVFAVCRRHLGPGPDAEDVFQDAVVALLRKPPRRAATFAQARAWLCGVARNKAVDRLGQRRRAAPLPDDPPGRSTEDGRPDDRLEAVLAAVAGLPERYRVPFQMAALDGLSHQDIAARLGLSVAAVQKRVERAREMVARAVADRGPAPAAPAAVVRPGTHGLHRAGELRPERAAALTAAVLGRLAARPGTRGWARTAGVLAAGVVLGGVAVAGWVWPRPAAGPGPHPAADLPARPGVPDPPPGAAGAETVPERALRVYRAAVLPAHLAHLRTTALGGDVELESVAARDVRVDCVFRVRRRFGGFGGREYRLALTHNAHTRRTTVYLDPDGRGEWTAVDPADPFPGWGPAAGGPTLSRAGLAGLAAAFDALPHDDRTAAEWEDFGRRQARAVEPFLGTWHEGGRPDRWIRLRLAGDRVEVAGWDGPVPPVGLADLSLDPPGTIAGLGPRHPGRGTLSADGRQVVFDGLGGGPWWTRGSPFP